MPLPPSFGKAGFVLPAEARKIVTNGKRRRRLMICTDGLSDSGKTEFILSAPGPGMVISLDRGFDPVLDNPNPPPSRRSDFGFKVCMIPKNTQAKQATYLEHWNNFYAILKEATDNPDAITVAIDGDSDSWELQRLAEHGKLTGVFPATRYTDVYAARRVMINRLWDSGKIIIATNRVKAEYKDILDANGEPIKDDQGQNKREKTGNWTREGFPDTDYLWQIAIRHLYQPPQLVHNSVLKRDIEKPRQWGFRIVKCKANKEVEGMELWGEDATFTGLVQLVYPQVELSEWGF